MIKEASSPERVSNEPFNSKRQRQLLTQQILLFRHLAPILRHLCERLSLDELPSGEGRSLQRELADMKKCVQAARHRLKASRSRDRRKGNSI